MPRTDWQTLHWDAVLAHKTVARAVKAGRLVPQPCETCGNAVSLAHHDDYEQRLLIRWLCDRHHRLWHIDHPLTTVVLAPPPRAKPVQERSPNRGRRFRQYLVPRVLRLRESGATYADIARAVGISTSTAHDWFHKAASTTVDA